MRSGFLLAASAVSTPYTFSAALARRGHLVPCEEVWLDHRHPEAPSPLPFGELVPPVGEDQPYRGRDHEELGGPARTPAAAAPPFGADLRCLITSGTRLRKLVHHDDEEGDAVHPRDAGYLDERQVAVLGVAEKVPGPREKAEVRSQVLQGPPRVPGPR